MSISFAPSRPLVPDGQGIETNTDAQHLTDIACDIGQGYLFGKPMPEQDMLRVVIEARADKALSVDPGTRAPAA